MKENLEIIYKGDAYISEKLRMGVFVDIQKAKALLSNGQYGNLWRMTTNQGDHALQMIDLEATFSVLFPELLNKLKPKSIRSLNVKDYKTLLTLYMEKIVPFVNSFVEILNDSEDDQDTKKG